MRRATLCFFDEAAFCSDELITVCEAFATQNTDFVTSIDEKFNPETEKRKVPTQLVYASSQDQVDKLFYKYYKNFTKRMIAGDRDYFVCDMMCDAALTTYMNGKKYIPLLTKDKVDAALKNNREKALREYYNQPTLDGGVNQIIKWSAIRKNEKFYLPTLSWKPNSRIVIAFDPARTRDNSIVSVMNMYQDQELGWCGDIINCINFIDSETKKKYQLDSNRQLENLRNILLCYNGQNPDYEYIDTLLIDSGAGGGGISTYADGLLNDWTDKFGKKHRGLIDKTNDVYSTFSSKYPNACDKLRIISPKKFRTKMVEEMIELMDLGVIRFPFEYTGNEILKFVDGIDENGDEIFKTYDLNKEEMLSLTNLDLMKNETTSIHKFENADKTSITYALAKDKETKLHDDRFYTLILLAHRLHEIRRGNIINKASPKRSYSDLPSCVSAINF